MIDTVIFTSVKDVEHPKCGVISARAVCIKRETQDCYVINGFLDSSLSSFHVYDTEQLPNIFFSPTELLIHPHEMNLGEMVNKAYEILLEKKR